MLLNVRFKINSLVIEILQIEDKIYTEIDLRNELKNKQLINGKIKISEEIKKKYNYNNNYINIDRLIKLIIYNDIQRLNYPNCKYYSYHQKPQFELDNIKLNT